VGHGGLLSEKKVRKKKEQLTWELLLGKGELAPTTAYNSPCRIGPDKKEKEGFRRDRSACCQTPPPNHRGGGKSSPEEGKRVPGGPLTHCKEEKKIQKSEGTPCGGSDGRAISGRFPPKLANRYRLTFRGEPKKLHQNSLRGGQILWVSWN